MIQKKKSVNIIKNRLKDLNNEINKMSEEERENERVDKLIEIVERILAYIKQQEKKEGRDIKILRPNQMLSRLPISLAQIEAGNNSNKLKNEIRQLLYSSYRSKNMTKQVYNDLIKHI